jgi:hypothetical protein
MKRIYISRDNQEFGPFSVEEVVQKLKAKELELLDYACEENKGHWTLLAEYTDIMALLKSEKVEMAKPLPKKPALVQETAEWFILKGEYRFGPFSYPDMVRMLQQKIVFGFDFAWHAGLTGWTRMAEITDFHEDAIRTLNLEASMNAVFTERKHPRKSHKGKVIVHNQVTWWNGEAFEISAGGVGVTMENAMIVPGTQIYLHFKPYENFPAFNATGEVVSKKYLENVKDKSTPLQYGIRFLTVSGSGKDKLIELLKDSAA